ncbi:MAG TPA: peptidoglycan DD-metalloendopeptidase family protein [bacterium]|nr:peptidoglycan DD-metalloendopeptidase family protein [bacterium]
MRMRILQILRVERLRSLLSAVSRRYSVMVHSGPDTGLKHFSLPALAVPGAAVLLFLGLVGGGMAVLSWTGARVERAHLAQLQAENQRLARQVEDFRQTVEVFESRMEETSQLERELRTLANLDPIPDDVRRLGVGGPLSFAELQDETSPFPQVRRGREALSRLEQLNRQADFQHANFREMVGTLRESREELDRIPSISPIRTGWYSSRYGNRNDPFTGRRTFHRGLDFSAWTGTPVYATADGKVRSAGRSGELGLLVEIDHGNGVRTRYGHNSKLVVKVGQQVKRGAVVAEVGSTGRSTSPHCHYEVHVDGRHVNPWRYILDGGPSMSSGA